jgi:hypothetical protein
MSEATAIYWAHYDTSDCYGKRYVGKEKVETPEAALSFGIWIYGGDTHRDAPDKIFIPKHSITLIEAFIKAP